MPASAWSVTFWTWQLASWTRSCQYWRQLSSFPAQELGGHRYALHSARQLPALCRLCDIRRDAPGRTAARRTVRLVHGSSRSCFASSQLASFAHVPELRVSTNAAPQKILQHMQRGGMLVEVNGRLLMICISTLSNLTVIERGTAETLKECQLRLSGATRASATFRQQIRLVCTDGCAANILCEKHVAAARGDACSAVHVLCDVHRTSLVHGKTLSLLDDNVRGVLRCALSLRNGAALSRFRRCLKDEIASRLQIIPGRPPVEAVAYKKAALRLFVAHRKNLAVRRVLLAVSPNGDWRAQQVQYYVGAHLEPQADRDSVLTHLTSGLLTPLLSSRPGLYPRAWIDSVGPRHGPEHHRYRVASCTAPSTSPSLAGEVGVAGLHDDEGLQALAVAHAAPVVDEITESGLAAGAAAGCSADDPSQDPRANEAGFDSATINAINQREAAAWSFNALPRSRLRQLPRSQFRTASAQWEEEQQCAAAQALEQGRGSWQAWEYRITIARYGAPGGRASSNKFYALWFEPQLWALLPPKSLTVSFRALSFSVISRAHCAIHQMLQVPRSETDGYRKMCLEL